MAKKNKRRGNPAKRAWQPLTDRFYDREQVQRLTLGIHPTPKITQRPSGAWRIYGIEGQEGIEVSGAANDLYSVASYRNPSGMVKLSIHRHDRAAVRDWRHFQQIKNEVVGPEIEAFEIYPAESRLMDTANEYAIFCLPPGDSLAVGWQTRDVMTPEQTEDFNKDVSAQLGFKAKAAQRAWQPGLTTGAGDGASLYGEDVVAVPDDRPGAEVSSVDFDEVGAD
jgi:hypothetical protein